MKKSLSLLAAAATCAALIPVSFAAGRMSKDDGEKMMGVMRVMDKHMSRRSLVNENLGHKARRARGFRPVKVMEKMEEKKMTPSSGASMSPASSAASSATSSSTSSSASSASSSSSN